MVSRIEASVGRSDDAAMQHAGHAHIVDKDEAARRLGGHVHARRRGADDAISAGFSTGASSASASLILSPPISSPYARRRLSSMRGRTTPSSTMSASGATSRIRGGPRNEEAPGLRRGAPQRNCAELNALAGDCWTLIRRNASVAKDHRHPLESDIQFLRDDLRERRADARAEINVSVEGRYLPCRRDDHERRERFRRRLIERGLRRRRPDNGQRARRFQIVRPAETLRLQGHHARIMVAASRTAARISRCAPHRQRLKRKASRISESEGSGFASMSACAVMIMPLRQ